MEKRRAVPYSLVKDDLGLLKRAYELRYRRRMTWKAIEQELRLSPAEGMTALHCVERYFDISKDPKVRAQGAEWRRQRRTKLRKRKSAALRSADMVKNLPVPSLIEEQDRNLHRANEEKLHADNLRQGLCRWFAAIDIATQELKRCFDE